MGKGRTRCRALACWTLAHVCMNGQKQVSRLQGHWLAGCGLDRCLALAGWSGWVGVGLTVAGYLSGWVRVGGGGGSDRCRALVGWILPGSRTLSGMEALKPRFVPHQGSKCRLPPRARCTISLQLCSCLTCMDGRGSSTVCVGHEPSRSVSSARAVSGPGWRPGESASHGIAAFVNNTNPEGKVPRRCLRPRGTQGRRARGTQGRS